MPRWYGRREGRRMPRLVGCLIWLFGGFTKGTKVSGAGPPAPLAAARHASPPPR